jgi:hypothetical protein
MVLPVVIFATVLTVGLAWSGYTARSWARLWAAAICALPLVMLGFVVGGIVLLAAFQLVAAAAGLRWQVSPRQRAWLHLLGVVVWTVVVPLQVRLAAGGGWIFPPGFLGIALCWVVLPLIPALPWRDGPSQAR